MAPLQLHICRSSGVRAGCRALAQRLCIPVGIGLERQLLFEGSALIASGEWGGVTSERLKAALASLSEDTLPKGSGFCEWSGREQ